MAGCATIETERKGPVLAIWLARPKMHNAIDDVMVSELDAAFRAAGSDPDVRAVVLGGRGPSFCVGADLNWMARMADAPHDENVEDSRRLAAMMWRIHDCPKPTVARIHGLTVGGGNGLAAACDLAFASTSASFRVAETRLGLVPAVISPFLLSRMGGRACSDIFLTARTFGAEEAAGLGLVTRAVPPGDLDREVDSALEGMLRSGPAALAAAKRLLLEVARLDQAQSAEYTARMIAEIRSSGEGREGIRAFLEKRDPRWIAGKQ